MSEHLTYSWLSRHRWNVVDLITVVAKDAIPVTIITDIDMTWAEELRQSFHCRGKRLTTTAILFKAIAIAQKSFPQSRSFIYPFGRILTLEKIVAGFTVERTVDSVDCVFFGTISEPDKKTLEEIAQELSLFGELSVEAHKQLNLEEKYSKLPWLLRQFFLQMFILIPRLRPLFFDASFGLSSLGKLGADFVSGPCVCTSTFSIGKIKDEPIVQNGEIIIRERMNLNLLYDQRCMDGPSAAGFLMKVKSLMEGELSSHLNPAP